MRSLLAGLGVLASSTPAWTDSTRKVPTLIYVDPVDYERRILLDACRARGVECVEVWSRPYFSTVLEAAVNAAQERAADLGVAVEELYESLRSEVEEHVAPYSGDEVAWAATHGIFGAHTSADLLGVLCGSDAGLATAERLQDVLVPTRSNGRNVARRDKFLTHHTLAAAGLASAHQAVVKSWPEAEVFLNTLGKPLRAVVKPRRGQGSLRVGLAHSHAEVKHMLTFLLSEAASLDHEEVAPGDALLQEMIDGDEWAVDLVSRNGEHKVVALWRYDKRPVNGAPFVYFCDELRGVEGPRERAICNYAMAALGVLGWRWGPSHLEIRDSSRGPVLVEANAGRFNGVNFLPLTSKCIGYTMYGSALDAFCNSANWEAIPSMPPSRLKFAGRLVKLVSSVEGVLQTLHHQDLIYALPSLLQYYPKYSPGEEVSLTVDLSSSAGLVLLAGPQTQVDQDYSTILGIQSEMFDVVTKASR
eukprot:scaffold164924_cov33-Tisochrysis_lutea.AAC.1